MLASDLSQQRANLTLANPAPLPFILNLNFLRSTAEETRSTNKRVSACVRLLPYRGVTRQWSFCRLQFFPFVFSFFQHLSRKNTRGEPDLPVSFRQSEKRRPARWPIRAPEMFQLSRDLNTRVTWSTEAVELARELMC